MNSNWTLMNYRELKKQIKKAVVELGTVLEFKGVVANTSELPLTGNKKGDVYIVSEDNTEYVWTSDNASGLITDYEELGPVISGSFLPPVTASDNGKVATVVDGEWTADSNALIVHFNYQDGHNTSSHTASEIKAAVDSGRPVFAFDSSGAFYALSQSVVSGATFVSIFGPSNAVTKRFVGTNGYVNIYNGSIVPAVSVTENGVELIGKDGAWAKQQKKFVVTLTPTAADYSGTMDKTVSEINEAYEAGQHIVFRTMMSATTYMDVDCTARWFGGSTYPSFNGFILSSDNGGTLIFAFTGATNDGTRATYGANIYALSYPSANGVSF